MVINTRRAVVLSALGVGAALTLGAPCAWADHPSQGTASQGTASEGAAGTKPAIKAAASRAVASAAPAARTAPARRTQTVRTTGRTTARAQPGLSITDPGQSPFDLSSGPTPAAELSGIAYSGGTDYYAVGDDGATSIWQVYTSLNGMNGLIRSSVVTGGLPAPGLGADSEGIAVRRETNSAWVSDEIASSITEFSLATGAQIGTVAVPSIYRSANVQNNMGLESLSYAAGVLWTANEEALRPDGELSTTTAGSWVRIQQFGGTGMSAQSQYAYRTDPISEMSPFITVERSGLVDLLALPDGRVLSLERELGGFLPHFRSRIYLLDFTGATDVSAVPTLSAGGFTAVTKTLLWQGLFGFSNFEGITLGPRLRDGSYGILLVSDNGSGQLGQRQTVLPLVLRGLTISPGSTPPATSVV